MAALSTIALASVAVGAGVSAFSSYQQGQTAKKTAEFNAKQMESEARRNEIDTSRQATRMQQNNARELSSVKAMFSKAGVSFSGSAAETYAERAFLLDLDIQDLVGRGGASSAQAKTQAQHTRRYGKKAATAGTIKAGTDILGGLTQMSGMTAGGV